MRRATLSSALSLLLLALPTGVAGALRGGPGPLREVESLSGPGHYDKYPSIAFDSAGSCGSPIPRTIREEIGS